MKEKQCNNFPCNLKVTWKAFEAKINSNILLHSIPHVIDYSVVILEKGMCRVLEHKDVSIALSNPDPIGALSLFSANNPLDEARAFPTRNEASHLRRCNLHPRWCPEDGQKRFQMPRFSGCLRWLWLGERAAREPESQKETPQRLENSLKQKARLERTRTHIITDHLSAVRQKIHEPGDPHRAD